MLNSKCPIVCYKHYFLRFIGHLWFRVANFWVFIKQNTLISFRIKVFFLFQHWLHSSGCLRHPSVMGQLQQPSSIACLPSDVAVNNQLPKNCCKEPWLAIKGILIEVREKSNYSVVIRESNLLALNRFNIMLSCIWRNVSSTLKSNPITKLIFWFASVIWKKP